MTAADPNEDGYRPVRKVTGVVDGKRIVLQRRAIVSKEKWDARREAEQGSFILKSELAADDPSPALKVRRSR